MNDPIYSMIGLAIRAGKVESGEAAVREAFEKGKAALLWIAADTSPRTTRFYQEMAQKKGVPVRVYGTKEQWGMVLGKRPRGLIAVIDSGFARNFLNKLEEMNM